MVHCYLSLFAGATLNVPNKVDIRQIYGTCSLNSSDPTAAGPEWVWHYEDGSQVNVDESLPSCGKEQFRLLIWIECHIKLLCN